MVYKATMESLALLATPSELLLVHSHPAPNLSFTREAGQANQAWLDRPDKMQVTAGKVEPADKVDQVIFATILRSEEMLDRADQEVKAATAATAVAEAEVVQEGKFLSLLIQVILVLFRWSKWIIWAGRLVVAATRVQAARLAEVERVVFLDRVDEVTF